MGEVVAAEMLRAMLTNKGLAAATQAATLGKPVKITHVGVTGTPGTPSEDMEALPGEVGGRVTIADGRVISSNQVNISALLPDTFPTVDITGLGFYLADGTLFSAYLSKTPLLNHVQGGTLLIGMDFVMDNIPADSVIVESTGANLIMGDWVPVSRRINNKPMNADINLTPADVGAAPATRKVNNKPLTADINLTPADIGAMPADYSPDFSVYALKSTKVNGQTLDKDVTITRESLKAAPSGFGLGAPPLVDRGDANRLQPNGWQDYNADGGDTNGPESYGIILHSGNHGNGSAFSGWCSQFFFSTSGRMFFRNNKAGGSYDGSEWERIYTNLRKPTPQELGVVAVAGAREDALMDSGSYYHTTGTDFNALPAGFCGLILAADAKNAPPAATWGEGHISVEVQAIYGGEVVQRTLPFRSSETTASRVRSHDGSWSGWKINQVARYIGPGANLDNYNKDEHFGSFSVDGANTANWPWNNVSPGTLVVDCVHGVTRQQAWRASSFDTLMRVIDATGSWTAWSSVYNGSYRPAFDNWQNFGESGLNVSGCLSWRHFGNSHAIFDASMGVPPTGGTIDNTNPQIPWGPTYPTLMGWNGVSTYGVRVDSARVADELATPITAESISAVTTAVLAAMFPVGHLLITTNPNSPHTYGYPGTWNFVEADTSLISVTSGGGGISGSNNPAVPLPSHAHSFSGTVQSAGEHLHNVTGYVGAAGEHRHDNGLAVASDGSNMPYGWEPHGGGHSYEHHQHNSVGRAHTSTVDDHQHHMNLNSASAGAHSHNYEGNTESAGVGSATIDVRGKCLAVYMWRRTA